MLAAQVYVDDDWIGTSLGADPDGGGPATEFGVDSFATIQAAVDAVDVGGTVTVGDGTYVENVGIDIDVTLESVNGRASTTIQGISSAGALGAVQVSNNTTAVQIGGIGHGFTIAGIDNGLPGIENAAIYFQGSHSDAAIIDNEVVAMGDHGLLTEYGATISGFVIDSNEFSGQTFIGPEPGGNGFGGQFTDPNVPRQLVTMGGGPGGGSTSNITFTNNQITGSAGGTNTGGEQGNTLVTIDSVGATITDNTFAGTTTRYGSALRARGTATVIADNQFDGSGMGAATNYLYLPSPATGSGLSIDPATLGDVLVDNTFVPGAVIVPALVPDTVFIAAAGIQAAIDAAAPSTELRLAGEFTENVNVNKAITLGGNFTLNGTLTVSDSGATLDAGFSPGVIASGSLALTSGSTLTAEINGLTPGTEHDQYVVTGTVDLGGATLDASGTIVANPADTVVLIDNDGVDAVTGMFAGLPAGASVVVNGYDFRIFYDGGDGNDVVLVAAVSTATIYVDDDWAGTPSGADPDGAGPAMAYGIDSFATIQDGIDAVNVGGNVVVFDGSYGEVLTIAKDVTVEADSPGGVSIDAGEFHRRCDRRGNTVEFAASASQTSPARASAPSVTCCSTKVRLRVV
ncbi:MAG: hypothetical protein R3C10_23355 [Pirellulales bacterium]